MRINFDVLYICSSFYYYFLSINILNSCDNLGNNDEQDEKVKPLVQQRGRFKVTSENVDIEKVTSK